MRISVCACALWRDVFRVGSICNGSELEGVRVCAVEDFQFLAHNAHVFDLSVL